MEPSCHCPVSHSLCQSESVLLRSIQRNPTVSIVIVGYITYVQTKPSCYNDILAIVSYLGSSLWPACSKVLKPCTEDDGIAEMITNIN
jgi:hypothetical protein